MRRSNLHAGLVAELAQLVKVPVNELPAVFLPAGIVRPLEIGIADDLVERYPWVSRHQMQRWFRLWTRTDAYRDALTVHHRRFTLDLCAGSDITPEARDYFAPPTINLNPELPA